MRWILFPVLILSLISCGSFKDEPMPLSQDNIKKYAQAVESSGRNTDPNSGSVLDRINKIYKEPLEKKMGYSFDKTIRYLFINMNEISANPSTTIFVSIMGPSARVIIENPEDALKSTLISQKTYEILSQLRNFKGNIGQLINNGDWGNIVKLVEVALDCQKANNGVCTAGKFLDASIQGGFILKTEMLLYQDASPEAKVAGYTNYLSNHYHLFDWDRAYLIVTPEGQTLNAKFMFNDLSTPFIVNQKVFDAAKKYATLVQEEKAGVKKN